MKPGSKTAKSAQRHALAEKAPEKASEGLKSTASSIGTRSDRIETLNRPYQPKRQRRSIKLDRVAPQDLAKFVSRFFCDDCSHYDCVNKICTMGYVPQHTRKQQLALYNLTGMMAFCRFLEID